MAVSIVVEPNVTTPAYNPVVFWVDSTNKNETGFKYVVDVYDAVGAIKIAEYRVAPEIVNGYGVIDLSKLLSSQVTKDFDLTSTTYYNATNSYFEYEVQFGEEYNASYAYTGFTNSSGYVQLTGFPVSPAHPFVVGDQIDLTEGTPTNPLLDGLHTVTAVGATTVTIDVLYADLVAPSSTAGDIIYADNRKTITRNDLTKSSFYVWNGALPWLDFRTYQDTQFLMSTIGARFLTNIPDNFYMRDDVEAFINWIPQSTATRRLFFENDNGDQFYKDVTSLSGEWVVGCSMGTGNLGSLTLVTGTAPLIKDDTEWYDLTLVDGSNVDVSETLRFYIDRTCEIESFDIMFMDRLGSFMPFSFTLKAFENGTITKTQYNQDNQGSASGTDWTYETTDRGMKPLSVDVSKEFTLNTNWMTFEMNQYFEELLTSPETYIKIDGTYQACIINESSFETVRNRGRKLIRKTIKVELANRDSVNG